MSYDISQKPLNLGYVYQTLCYGGENEEIWLDLGAKVVNGAKGGNNFVLLAPEKFLYLWTHGKTFLEAVNGGFNFEVMISRIVPILSVRDEDIESGQMIFAGDNYYSLK
ncbi:MAG: hypothetical protein NTY11_00830 [Candidatus Parcubacteria bacterium]|nr:hypothetical protein [Candidatus Parcubacteria bacterium]